MEDSNALLATGDAVVPGEDNRKARLRIDFTIDEQRWLRASIYDLLRDREIRDDQVTKLR